jgi:hypothetical protein
MNQDSEFASREKRFDDYLSRHLAAEALPDHGFSDLVEARLTQAWLHRRRIRHAGITAAAIAVLASLAGSAPASDQAALTPATLALALVLATVCALVWIGVDTDAA